MRTLHLFVSGLLMLALQGEFQCGAEEPKGQLRVSTVPAGATVTCDGILRDQSPVELEGLAAGDHLVQVDLAGYASARRTVPIAAGQKAAVEIEMEALKGLVLIHAVPDGADVQIEGAHRGKAPLLLTDLPLGRYRVRGSAPGYQVREVELLVDSRTPNRITLELPSDSSTLTIASTPPGASVTVDGLSRGVTPCALERLQSGDVKIVLNLENYSLYQDTVKLKAGETHAVDVTLQPIPATLSLISVPAGAKIFLNNELRGMTPLKLDPVPPGACTIRAELEGYETQNRTLELRHKEVRVEEFTLPRQVGFCEVMTDQGGVSVHVDGVEMGVFPDVDKLTDPLRLELPVGERRLELRKKGYLTLEKKVLIARGEVAKVREAMKRNFVPDTAVRLRSGELVTGVAGRKFPDGDVEVETRPGIFRTLKASEIASVGAADATSK